MFTGGRLVVASVGLLLSPLATVACGGSPAVEVTSSSAASPRPSVASFSTYLACSAYEDATRLEAVLRDFISGTAARRDLAAPLRDLAVSLSVIDASMVEDVEGWDSADIDAYRALGEEVRRFRVRLLDGPKPESQEIRTELERYINATRMGAPPQCPDIY